jgi:hypothetical protein
MFSLDFLKDDEMVLESSLRIYLLAHIHMKTCLLMYFSQFFKGYSTTKILPQGLCPRIYGRGYIILA